MIDMYNIKNIDIYNRSKEPLIYDVSGEVIMDFNDGCKILKLTTLEQKLYEIYYTNNGIEGYAKSIGGDLYCYDNNNKQFTINDLPKDTLLKGQFIQ